MARHGGNQMRWARWGVGGSPRMSAPQGVGWVSGESFVEVGVGTWAVDWSSENIAALLTRAAKRTESPPSSVTHPEFRSVHQERSPSLAGGWRQMSVGRGDGVWSPVGAQGESVRCAGGKSTDEQADGGAALVDLGQQKPREINPCSCAVQSWRRMLEKGWTPAATPRSVASASPRPVVVWRWRRKS
jgi:hypothetical protein